MNRLAARGLLALALLIAIIAAVPAPAKIEADSTGATSGRPQVDVLT